MTLLEVLAVIVLLGLTASIVAWRAQRGPDAALRAAESIVRGFDTRARIAAPSFGPVSLTLEDDQWLALRAVEDDRIIAREALPDRVTVRLFALSESGSYASAELMSVSIDASGRSIDYLIEIRIDDAVRRLAIAGLTGWIEGVEQ